MKKKDMPPNECFKVLYKERTGNLFSCAKLVLPPGAVTRYYKTKETFPTIPGTPIFAFRTLEAAIKFTDDIDYRSSLVIWRCYYRDEFKRPNDEYMLRPRVATPSSIERFWKYGGSVSYETCSQNIPSDTVFVKSLVLIEQVISFLRP